MNHALLQREPMAADAWLGFSSAGRRGLGIGTASAQALGGDIRSGNEIAAYDMHNLLASQGNKEVLGCLLTIQNLVYYPKSYSDAPLGAS